MENTIRKNKIIQAIAILMAAIIALSSIGSVTALAASVPKTSITSVTAIPCGFKITIKKGSGVDGYQLQFATNKGFTKNVETLNCYTPNSTTTKTYSGMKSKTKYYIRVRSYVYGSYSSKTYSAWSSTKTVTTLSKLKKTTVKTAWKTSNTLKITWKKVSGASGYQIQYATNYKFTKNKKTYTVKKASKTSKTIKVNLLKDYYVRVRSYKTVNGKKYYSAWSSVKWGDYYDNQRAYEVIQTLGIKNSMSDLEKVARVQNWINHNWVYDSSTSGTGNDIWKTKKGVCEQFSNAFYGFMNVLGIENFFLSGSNHAWNAVKIDGYWYQYDCIAYSSNDYDFVDLDEDTEDTIEDYISSGLADNFTQGYCRKTPSSVMDSKSLKNWKACSPKGTVSDIEVQFATYHYQLIRGLI